MRRGRARPLSDRQAVRIAMIASVVIALFSFLVAPLLWFAPEGLWQIIRIFTGFYNIPIVAIVIVGLFARRVPAIGAKIVIGFHVIAYGLLKFVFDDFVTLHFLHLYAILFAIEVGIMLFAGKISPRETEWRVPNTAKVDLTPWRFARPVAFSLMSAVVALYLVLLTNWTCEWRNRNRVHGRDVRYPHCQHFDLGSTHLLCIERAANAMKVSIMQLASK